MIPPPPNFGGVPILSKLWFVATLAPDSVGPEIIMDSGLKRAQKKHNRISQIVFFFSIQANINGKDKNRSDYQVIVV